MTNPWWLEVGALCGGTRSYAVTLRKLETLEGYVADEESRGNEGVVGYLREERRHAVLDFLENPGYADESQLRRLQRFADDVLSESSLETCLSGRWQRHLAVLRLETFLHIASIISTALVCITALSGLIAWLPAPLSAAIGVLWLVLVYIELIWSGSLSGTMRRLFVPDHAVGGITPAEQLRLALHGLRFWRRPVAWLFVLLLAKPLTVKQRGRPAPAAH